MSLTRADGNSGCPDIHTMGSCHEFQNHGTFPWMSKFKIKLNEFTPAEAQYITGLSTVMQLDWRRRGFLPKKKGHARFNAMELAEMFMLRLFADYDLRLERFAPAAKVAAQGIVYYALELVDHYEGTVDALDRFCVVENEPQLKVLRELGFAGKRLKKYMIVWADQTVRFTDGLDDAFCSNRDRLELNATEVWKQNGPVQVFNLCLISSKFSGLPNKPFVHVGFVEGYSPYLDGPLHVHPDTELPEKISVEQPPKSNTTRTRRGKLNRRS